MPTVAIRLYLAFSIETNYFNLVSLNSIKLAFDYFDFDKFLKSKLPNFK